MQIHELNNFTGTLGAGAYLAVDDGNDTGKLSTQQLLAATEARIDNIIAGPAPSAEEIVDARLGDDGVTYPSLGDAIRDQVSDLKDDLGEITYNMFSTKDITAYYNMTYDGKHFTNTVADTKTYVVAQLLLYSGSTLNEVIPFSSVSLGRTAVTFVPQNDADAIMFRHSGSKKDLGFRFDCTLTAGQSYNASFYCSSDTPNAVGGFVVYDFQLEQSSVTSPYLPKMTATDYVAREQFITPEMFGAIGDGITDDTLAIQNAIYSGYYGGYSTIRLKNKTYKVNSRLYFTSNIKIIGDNGATILWNDSITGEDALFSGSALHDITIENITFDFGTQNVLRYGISLINSHNITVRNCVFTHGYGYAWRINNDYDVLFENCDFNSITGGTGNPGGGIFGSNFHDVRVSKCSCDTIDDHFVYIAGTTESYNVIVENCVCFKTGQNGLTNGSAICVYALAHDVVITGNIIRQSASGIYVGKYGEYTTLPQNILISNNIISYVTQNGIHIEGLSDSAMVTRLSIVGNVVRSSAQDAIKLIYSAYVTCAENVVAFPTRYGIALDRVAYSTFTGNVITEVTNTALMVGSGTRACIYCKFDNMFLMQASGDYASYGLYSRNANYCEYTNIKAINFRNNYVYGGGAYNSYINSQSESETKSIYFTNDITRADYHNVGDVVIASNPTVGNPVMWICTEAGAPGTMTPMVTL